MTKLFCLLVIGLVALIGGIVTLAVLPRLPVSDQYREAAISYEPHQVSSKIIVRVVEGDYPVMRDRVVQYVAAHTEGTSYVDEEWGFDNGKGMIIVPMADASLLATLQQLRSRRHQLTPNYRNWPHPVDANTVPLVAGPHRIKIVVKDIGPQVVLTTTAVGLTLFGAVCVFSTMLVAGSIWTNPGQ